MDFIKIREKREYYQKNVHLLSDAIIDNYESAFAIEYTHNSTAIEGNTISLAETKLLLEDKVSVGGKDIREIYEVMNHNKAFDYIQKCIDEGKPLDENIIKDIHNILMENIMVGGIYRNVDVYISGAQHVPPTPQEMYAQVKNFYADLLQKNDLNPIELAAWTHAEFVKIHPFVDGNGRTSRLIMNYQLMANGFLPVSIAKENRLTYFEKLESYAIDNDIESFSDFIAALEDARLDRYITAINQVQDTTECNEFKIGL